MFVGVFMGMPHKMVIYASVYGCIQHSHWIKLVYGILIWAHWINIWRSWRERLAVFVCVHLCVRKWGRYKAYRQSWGFYEALLLCLNPMKTRPHLNPAFILYKYLSLSLLLFKPLRFILDKCLTPKPPLKEPTCPQ